MTPALNVEFSLEATREPWCFALFRHVTPRTGHAGAAARAGVLAFPPVDREGPRTPSRNRRAFIATLMDSGVEFLAVDNPHANKPTVHILAAVAKHARAPPLRNGSIFDNCDKSYLI